MHRPILTLSLYAVLAACGGGSTSSSDGGNGASSDAGSSTDGGNGAVLDGGDAYTAAVHADADAICRYDDTCRNNADGHTYEHCVNDVRVDLFEVRPALVDAGLEDDCLECLKTRTATLVGSLNAACAPPDGGAVIAACGAQKESCLGKP